jgi:hypothetical protein
MPTHDSDRRDRTDEPAAWDIDTWEFGPTDESAKVAGEESSRTVEERLAPIIALLTMGLLMACGGYLLVLVMF